MWPTSHMGKWRWFKHKAENNTENSFRNSILVLKVEHRLISTKDESAKLAQILT